MSIDTKSIAEWIGSTVRPADVMVGRAGWAGSPLAHFAERFRQYVIICASLNASNVSKVPLRLYSVGTPRRSASKCVPVKKTRKAWLRNENGVGVKAAVYAGYADDNIQEVVSHPALDLLRNPNPFMDGSYFIEWIAASMEVTGNGFVYGSSEGKSRKPDALLPLMSHYTRVACDSQSFVRGYWYGRNQIDPIEIPAENVAHFKSKPNPFDPYYGLSPLQAAMVEADLANAATVAEWHRWRNGGRPDYTIMTDEPLNDEQKKQVRAEVETFTKGTDKSGNFLVLSKAEVKPLGFAPKEMEYLAGLSRSDEIVWNAFGVPQSLVRLNDANLASSETGHVQYQTLTINPRCSRIAETFTDWLLPKFGVRPGSMWFAFDDASHEAEESERSSMLADVNAGALTIDEYRAELGMDPLPDGLGAMPRFNGTPLDKMGQSADPLAGLFGGKKKPDAEMEDDAEDAGDETQETDGETDSSVAVADEPKEEAKAITHKIAIPKGLAFYGDQCDCHVCKDDRAETPKEMNLRKLGEKFYNELQDYYRSMASKILDDGPFGTITLRDGDLLAIIDRNIGELFRAGLLNGYASAGMPAADGTFPTPTRASIERFIGNYVPKLAQSISADLNISIRDSIIDGITNGMSYQDTAAQIREAIPDMAKWRAERVARSETSRAIGRGEVAAWKDLGFEGKEYLLSGNPCPVCEAIAAANPKPIPVDEPFAKVGQTYAGVTLSWDDIQSGGEAHPNCGCSQAVVDMLDENEHTQEPTNASEQSVGQPSA